ncbi:hypothetical protein GOACH_36_00090 [Gordonia aichiensis NBRC 108223]|uniref:Uncharacterized protein n=2 Tax=Gordonia aichiensis TaxID=36820 RepID=L7KST2_9ACTN|nr:hypothetical protein GOACH_36_00090 [Gordonia aichiensis NBRC 108223]
MTFKDPLHQGQVDVLQWVADGCPEGRWQGHAYKMTANALAGRRLLKVSKKGGGWQAEMLPAGTHYLAHGDYPPGHWKTRRNGGIPVSPDTTTSTSPPPPRPRPSSVPKPRTVRKPSASGEPKPTQKLVDDLLAADGRLVRDVSDDSPNYSHLVGIINGRKLVPDGDVVLLTKLNGHRVEIRLASTSDWTTQKPGEIADSTRSRKGHPAVAELRTENALSSITPTSVRARAFRLLNALAIEAKARGIGVSIVKIDSRGYRQAFDGYHGHLLFQFDELRCVVTVSQLSDRVPHVPTKSELERQRRGYTYIPTHDNVKSERLSVFVNADSRYSRRQHWDDTKNLPLEYRLHDVLAEMIDRNDAEKARIERERLEAIERRKRDEIATARATEAYYEQRRIDTLLGDFSRFAKRRELSEFLVAMEQHAACFEGDERVAADEWLTWCRQYIASLGPFARPLAMPTTKPPDYSQIAEFKQKLGYGRSFF